jgi:DNA modification methylase
MTRKLHTAPDSDIEPPDTPEPLSNSKGHFDDFRLTVSFVETATLKPSPHRARIHPDEQIAQVAESIQSFGFLRQILVGKDREIIAGHAIYEAARRLGRTEVPISDVSHLDEASQRAFALADNKIPENAAWDADAVAREFKFLTSVDVPFAPEITGFSSIEIDFALTDADSEQDADIEAPLPDPATEPVAKLGDIWVLGSHKLFVGSALEAGSYVTLMGDEEARMVFTDPPYNVEINGIVGNGSAKHEEFLMASGEMSREEFTGFLLSFMQLSAAYTIGGGLNYVCMDWRHMQEVLSAGAKAYSELLNLVVWAKTNGGMDSFYRSQHELIFVFKAGTGKHLNNIQLGRFGRNRTNVWSYPGMTSNSRERAEMLEKHPTVKPVVMVADAIRDTSRRGEIILDPFAGSGTTIIAAEKTGRICRAIELDPKFADVIVTRWQAHTGRAAVHAATGVTFNDLKVRAQPPEAEPGLPLPAQHPIKPNSAGGEAIAASPPQIRERRRPVHTTASNA